MVETCGHDGFFEHGASVWDQCGIEQHHVGGIREHALVNGGLIGEIASRSDPDMEAAAADLLAEIAIELDRPQLDWTFALIVAANRIRHHRKHALLDLRLARERIGLGHRRHLGLMSHAGLVAMK
jgi:hypothetical protein